MKKHCADEIMINMAKELGLVKQAELEIIPESHLDHGLSEKQVEFIKDKYKDCSEFTLETIEVPGTVECALYGPIMGDAPVSEEEVFYANRGAGRNWDSRLINKPTRQTNKVTVIMGSHGDKPCVLYTAYGGPNAPQEPGDPNARDLAQSKSFWAQHALATNTAKPKKESEQEMPKKETSDE